VDIAYEGSQASRIYKYNFKPSRSHLLSNIRYARAQNARYEYHNSDFIAGTVVWGPFCYCMMVHAGKLLPSVMNIHVHNQGQQLNETHHTCITGITGVSQVVSNMDKAIDVNVVMVYSVGLMTPNTTTKARLVVY
jgi:hypothetical protein